MIVPFGSVCIGRAMIREISGTYQVVFSFYRGRVLVLSCWLTNIDCHIHPIL